jgi:hypothetical protein
MPQASQNAALRVARRAELGQHGSRPVISTVAQFDNITSRREIIQCHGLALRFGPSAHNGLTPAAAGATLASVYAGNTTSMNSDLGRLIWTIHQE